MQLTAKAPSSVPSTTETQNTHKSPGTFSIHSLIHLWHWRSGALPLGYTLTLNFDLTNVRNICIRCYPRSGGYSGNYSHHSTTKSVRIVPCAEKKYNLSEHKNNVHQSIMKVARELKEYKRNTHSKKEDQLSFSEKWE